MSALPLSCARRCVDVLRLAGCHDVPRGRVKRRTGRKYLLCMICKKQHTTRVLYQTLTTIIQCTTTITYHTANVQRPTYNSIAVYSTLFERNVTALLRNGPAVGLCVKECCIPAHAGRRNIKRRLRTMSIQQVSLAALRYYVLTSVNLKTFSRSYKYCT